MLQGGAGGAAAWLPFSRLAPTSLFPSASMCGVVAGNGLMLCLLTGNSLLSAS